MAITVLALHVHHGLSPNADAWLEHCKVQCGRWARRGWPVRFRSCRLQSRPVAGESVEAWARQARYRALRAMALEEGATAVLLAHHRRDQAETLLLQALRGAGVAGLAGMPAIARRDGLSWLRPWLSRPRAEIEAYVRRHRLRHIHDESNDDPRFARNRLRLEVWPALNGAFPQSEAALASSARWAQEALVCLDELADEDLLDVADKNGLQVQAWSALTPARRSNALRRWLRTQTGNAAAANLVSRLLSELSAGAGARWPIEAGELRSYRGVLRFQAIMHEPRSLLPPETMLSVRRAGAYSVPGWQGRLQVERVKEGGVPMAWLAHLELRRRSGAEQFQAGIGRPPRSLKKQYQAAGIPAWERAGPLLYSGGQLVFVPGLGIDARVMALPKQAQVSLSWLPYVAT